MSYELIEALVPIRAHYKGPDGHARLFQFETGKVNKVPSDVLGVLLAKDFFEGYFHDGTLRLLDPKQANARVDGMIAYGKPEVLAAQVAAEAYARAKDGVKDPSLELKEITGQQAAIEAALRRGKIVDPPKPTELKDREHGVAYDADEVKPPPRAGAR